MLMDAVCLNKETLVLLFQQLFDSKKSQQEQVQPNSLIDQDIPDDIQSLIQQTYQTRPQTGISRGKNQNEVIQKRAFLDSFYSNRDLLKGQQPQMMVGLSRQHTSAAETMAHHYNSEAVMSQAGYPALKKRESSAHPSTNRLGGVSRLLGQKDSFQSVVPQQRLKSANHQQRTSMKARQGRLVSATYGGSNY